MRLDSIRGIGIGTAYFLLVCCLFAFEEPPLRQLTQDKRFFEVRRELPNTAIGTPDALFYRGVVAVRFGREDQGIGLLRDFLATNPPPRKSARGTAGNFFGMGAIG